MFFTYLTDTRNLGLTNSPYLVLPPVRFSYSTLYVPSQVIRLQ